MMSNSQSTLYLHDTYLNKNIELLTNQVIIEYDLKSANTNLSKEYGLLPMDKIQKIADMPRQKRVETIGKLMRKDAVFKEGLKAAFVDMRKRFFEANEIEDGDILAVRKDAIWCLRPMKYTEFGACTFVEKNIYTSFLRLGNLEIFYSPKLQEDGTFGKLEVKGINDNDLLPHQDYLMKFFKTLFKHLETSDQKTAIRYLTRFIDKYKFRQLELGYYREFSPNGIFRVLDSDITYDQEAFIPGEENRIDYLDIDYNFSNVILPIVKILL